MGVLRRKLDIAMSRDEAASKRDTYSAELAARGIDDDRALVDVTHTPRSPYWYLWLVAEIPDQAGGDA